MSNSSPLQKQANAKGISVRALIVDAVDGAVDYDAAAAKLRITRQGLIQAMEKHEVQARKITRLEIVMSNGGES